MSEARYGLDDYVLRALNAAEIAESCLEPRLRQSFFDLSETWLVRAGEDAGFDED